MTSKYHRTEQSQGKTPPAGYTERLKIRAARLSFDPEEITRAEARGGSLPVRPGGGSSGACFKVHISAQHQNREKKIHHHPVLSSTGTILGRYLGSPETDDREFYKVDLFRTSAIFRRQIQTPTYHRQGKKQHLDADHRARIARFHIDNNIPLMSWEETEAAYNGTNRGKIDSFTRKSRHNLKFKASNCFPLLISQFCASYGETVTPRDGRTSKRHLDNFLHAVRRKYPHVAYLWLLEFQNRGAAHYHIFFNFPVRAEIRAFLARAWVRATGATDEEEQKMMRVHLSPRNFIPWNMKKAGYLTKYLSKSSQKQVPPNFQDVGRFWGTSRNLVPPPESLDMQEPFGEITHTDKLTGETFMTKAQRDLYRICRRHHEASLRQCGIKRKSRLCNTGRTTTHLPSGGLVIQEYFAWKDREEWKKTGLKESEIPF